VNAVTPTRNLRTARTLASAGLARGDRAVAGLGAQPLNLPLGRADQCWRAREITTMNHSLLTADRRTHGKIMVLALIAAIAVIGVGLTARITESGPSVVTAHSESVGPAPDAGRTVRYARRETIGLH
jgi:hypothetical protein